MSEALKGSTRRDGIREILKEIRAQHDALMAFDEILASETKFCKAVIDNCLLPGAGLGTHHKNTAAFTCALRRLLCDYGQGLPQTIQERHIAECVHNALVMAADDVVYDGEEV